MYAVVVVGFYLVEYKKVSLTCYGGNTHLVIYDSVARYKIVTMVAGENVA